MKINQIYNFTNIAVKEAIGESAVLKEDLTNIVDVGTAIIDANAVDAYVKALVNQIGRVIVNDRVYTGENINVLMDSWEFGSVCEKISFGLLDAEENESWNLQDRASYDPNIFYQPKVVVKFFNELTTFDVPISITYDQLTQSFTSAMELNKFVSGVWNAVETTLTVKTDELIKRTINNFTAETIYNEYQGTDMSLKSGVRAINLLKLYKTIKTDATTTATNYIADKEFIRFATKTMRDTMKQLRSMSTVYNIGGQPRHTPEELLHVILLQQFESAVTTFLESDTFHNEFVKLPNGDTTNYWQGSGEDYSLASVSKIDVKTRDGHDVTVSNVLAVMFDRDALGVALFDRKIRSNYNGKADFWNYWNGQNARYFNDFNENFVVFFVA